VKKERLEEKNVKKKIVEKPDPVKAFIARFSILQCQENELRVFIEQNYVENSVDTDRVLRKWMNTKSEIIGEIRYFIAEKKEQTRSRSAIRALSDIQGKLNELSEELYKEMNFLGYRWSLT